MWLTTLLKYKKHIATATAILSLIVIYNSSIDDAYEKGFTAATTELQLKHNKLIAEQISKHTAEMNLELAEYDKKLLANKSKRDIYWQSKLDEHTSRLKVQHKIDLEAQRIKDEANNIDGHVSDDALKLFQYSRRIISKPTD